jgi:integrase
MGNQKFGNVRQLKSGRFQARYRLPSGEQASAGTFDLEPLAQERLDEIEVDLRRGIHWDARKGKTKFRDFMVEYMGHRKLTVSTGEFANNRSYLKVHLLPFFGNLRMEEVDEEVVDKWFATQPRTETRRNVYAFLRRALKYAVKWKYVRVSPCNVLESKKSGSVPRPTWMTSDFERVLQCVPETIQLNRAALPTKVYYREALQVMFAAHLRLGELIGLNADDYDRKTLLLRVERQVTARGETTDTKTGSRKTIRPLSMGVSALDRIPRSIGTAPLIPGAKSKRLPRLSLQRAWKQAVREAGFENFHIHDIRHIGLSLVAASGAPMKDVMTRGGHASVQSAARYQHSDVDRDRKVAEEVDRLMG